AAPSAPRAAGTTPRPRPLNLGRSRSGRTPMPTTAAPDRTTTTELDRQLENLLRLGYPALMGRTESELRSGVDALSTRLPGPSTVDPEDHIPFVLVPAAPLRES